MVDYLYGKDVSDKIKIELKQNIDNLKRKDIIPHIALIRFGENKDDILYEKSIKRNFENYGINVSKFIFGDNFIKEKELFEEINNSTSTHAIIIFGKVPESYNYIKRDILAEKDVDCMGEKNNFSIYHDAKPVHFPCTPLACIKLMEYYNIDVKSKNIVIIGRSKIVGLPLSLLLLNKDATVTICHSKTKNMKDIIKNNDIIISSAGKPGLIKKDFLSDGQVVIDISTNFLDGKLCGDVESNAVSKEIRLTPVPGGVGNVTTTVLAMQTVNACMLQSNINI